VLDKDIRREDVQGLSSADQVAAFFSVLGYRTEARLPQTPANLGITAEPLTRQVTRLERIADHEGLLQVYLFELSSVTVAATRGIASALRNRAGNYLLVLTHDYDRIERASCGGGCSSRRCGRSDSFSTRSKGRLTTVRTRTIFCGPRAVLGPIVVSMCAQSAPRVQSFLPPKRR